ncbi:Copper homeostasis protein cutC [Abortiporus biennis]
MTSTTALPDKILIEVCVDSVESAIAAVAGGADRLELCANIPLGGGTTPSLGLFKIIKRVLPNAPIMVMIRPRTGDFVYTPSELEVMLEDIQIFKQAEADGVVFGVLTPESGIDIYQTNLLVEKARPLEVCFHRAFDMTYRKDPFESSPLQIPLPNLHLNTLSSIPGITRILTSGFGPTVHSSLLTLVNLFQSAHSLNTARRSGDNPLTILPGSGINPNTIRDILKVLLPVGLKEIHMSGGRWDESEAKEEFRNNDIDMGGWKVWRTDEGSVRRVREIVDQVLESEKRKLEVEHEREISS